MICRYEEYGTDIDGNRGTNHLMYELTDDDTNEVCLKLYDYFADGQTGIKTIMMYCPQLDGDIEVEINMSDYEVDLIKMARENEKPKEYIEIMERRSKHWLKDREC